MGAGHGTSPNAWTHHVARRPAASRASTMRVPVELYRGGTSRGLVLATQALAPFPQAVRDRILCTAMGSPDPDGRQIDGVGGGVSSLSKAAIVSVPASAVSKRTYEAVRRLGDAWAFPGAADADDPRRAADPRTGYDVVYRFGQVPVHSGYDIDWSSTCGNFLSAAALHAYTHHAPAFGARIAQAATRATYRLPLRLLLADSGKRVTVHVPLERTGSGTWVLSRHADTQIAGVPGRAPGLQIHVPLDAPPLPTGRARDTVHIQGRAVPVSVVDTGLPVVFVHAADLQVPREHIVQTAAQLDADPALLARVEEVRQQAARLTPALAAQLCMSAPKVCLVHPRTPYTTSGGASVAANDMDVLVRAVSVGQVHRSIMATALSSLVTASAYTDSVVAEAWRQGGGTHCPASAARSSSEGLRALTVGHPAGTSLAMVQLAHDEPVAVVYDRTARCILHGHAEIPPFPGLAQAQPMDL
ncbi:Uncharacterized protein MSYG_2765 [Malassezia sympodialis ATCC 42132]|uniref:Uncharacterized protein n=2 Tax=Malassezia sympodialis (strain ATCC 42132) TaxID=1230383 RepID=A0A1M8A7N0_MALS4|nr:Uncharacterized protein MSYG_2765 [Malassezia sympodialis ATCC 42132]